VEIHISAGLFLIRTKNNGIINHKMERKTNIDRLSQPAKFYVSVAAFILVIISIILTFWFATELIEYQWRWYQLPKYLIYKADIQIVAESDGEVDEIKIKGDKADIIIAYDNAKKTYTVPMKSYDIDEGEMISEGEVIAEYKGGYRPGVMLLGLWITLKVSIYSTIFGVILGLVGGIMRVSKNFALKWLSIVYVELIRGSPLLVQIFMWYFVIGTLINQLLAKFGYKNVDPVFWGVAALSVFTGAYVVEIVRAGIESIHFGQKEAARSLGMSYLQSMRHVILPPAIRRILPPLAGQFINLIKDSSLIGIIGIRELLRSGREVIITNLTPFEIFMTVAVLYLVLTFTLSMFVQYLERRGATN
jgi:polar amino acid transport system permease protein